MVGDLRNLFGSCLSRLLDDDGKAQEFYGLNFFDND